jgi:hypothetical protein
MTNEQLSIFMTHVIARLELAVETVDGALEGVEGIERHEQQRYTGGRALTAFMGARDPEDWETFEGDARVLDPIREVICELRDQARDLFERRPVWEAEA